MKFWKFEAAGNDFVLLNSPVPASEDEARIQVRTLCALHTGIGSDGLVYCWKEGNDWKWRFFNSDSSETDLCGNAARAVALWLHEQGAKNQKEWTWGGRLGTFRARQSEDKLFEVTWSLPDSRQHPIPEELMRVLLHLNERGLAGAYSFKVGVPHLVLLNFEQWNMEDRQIYGPMLRSHAALGAEGANVTWVGLKGQEAVTFERGVEGETLACGSGALAAFLSLDSYEKEKSGEGIEAGDFQFPGGKLGVRREGRALWLKGPTRLVFEGEYNP